MGGAGDTPGTPRNERGSDLGALSVAKDRPPPRNGAGDREDIGAMIGGAPTTDEGGRTMGGAPTGGAALRAMSMAPVMP